MSKIKNIIFDLGGVILNLDYDKTKQAFIDLGFYNFDEIYSQFRQSSLFDQLEVGAINTRDFINEVKVYLPGKIASDNDIIEAWNAMLLDIPQSHFKLLEKLKQSGYNLFLLSNTNTIHYRAFFDYIEQLTGKRSLSGFFQKEYYSHLIGKRKPHKEVFLHIIHEQDIDISSTLFIDDSPQHIEGAKKVGLHTIQKKQADTLEETIAAMNIEILD